MTETTTIEVEGWHLEAEYDYSKGERETYHHPGAPSSVSLRHLWINLIDKNNNTTTVDVLGFLCTTGIVCAESIEEEILESWE